jgi:hypothetical protein
MGKPDLGRVCARHEEKWPAPGSRVPSGGEPPPGKGRTATAGREEQDDEEAGVPGRRRQRPPGQGSQEPMRKRLRRPICAAVVLPAIPVRRMRWTGQGRRSVTRRGCKSKSERGKTASEVARKEVRDMTSLTMRSSGRARGAARVARHAAARTSTAGLTAARARSAPGRSRAPWGTIPTAPSPSARTSHQLRAGSSRAPSEGHSPRHRCSVEAHPIRTPTMRTRAQAVSHLAVAVPLRSRRPSPVRPSASSTRTTSLGITSGPRGRRRCWPRCSGGRRARSFRRRRSSRRWRRRWRSSTA